MVMNYIIPTYGLWATENINGKYLIYIFESLTIS
jgi:hypothetical protein